MAYLTLKLSKNKPGYLIASEPLPEDSYVDISNESRVNLAIKVPAGLRVFQNKSSENICLYAPLGLKVGEVIEITPEYESARISINGHDHFRILRQKHIDQEGGLANVIKDTLMNQQLNDNRGAA